MRRVEETVLMSHTACPANGQTASDVAGHLAGHIVLIAPLSGPVVLRADVPDPVFSGGMFGDGIGVDPLEGKLVAPCDGVVTHIARTGHAATIVTAEGAEVLLHIG